MAGTYHACILGRSALLMLRRLLSLFVCLVYCHAAIADCAVTATSALGTTINPTVLTRSTAPITTLGGPQLLILYATTNSQGGAFASIASISGGGLSWTRGWKSQNVTLGGCYLFGACAFGIEQWHAIAPSALASQTFTVTYNTWAGTVAFLNLIVIAIGGANTSTPFDTNASLPGVATNITGQPGTPTHQEVDGITTDHADDLLLFYCFGNQVTATNVSCDTEPSSSQPWTLTQSRYQQNIFTVFFNNSAIYRQLVSTFQLSQNYYKIDPSFTSTNWVAAVDAIQCGTAPPPPPLQAPQRPFAYGWPW